MNALFITEADLKAYFPY